MMRRFTILSAALPVALVLTSSAVQASFVAFNDFAGTPATNNTALQNEGSVILKNQSDGTATPVTLNLHFVSSTGHTVADSPNMPNPGTAAYNLFNGFANADDFLNGGAFAEIIDLTFSGLTDNTLYTISILGNRSGTDNRLLRAVISGMDSATNDSGAAMINATTSQYTTQRSFETPAGLVNRWTNIDPGSDGTFVVRLDNPNSDFTTTLNLLRFEDQAPASVPEPSTFALAILGLFGLGTLAWRCRWRRRENCAPVRL